MKLTTILLLLFASIYSLANDTLTRAQVYNFNVGDTFDYRSYNYAESVITSNLQWTVTVDSTSYSRCVITNIYYSSDSSTKYVERLNLFKGSATLDTLILQNLNGYEVYLDTVNYFIANGGAISIGFTSQFNNCSVDTLYQYIGSGGPSWETFVFANGLGITSNIQWGGMYWRLPLLLC